MKPSHIQTPRTMADCTYEVGYYGRRPDQSMSWSEGIAYSIGGILMFAGALALMLAYFDVLIP